MLYPLKFKPIFKEKVWGAQRIKTILGKDFSPLPNCGESWEISGVAGDETIIANGFLAGNNINEIVEIYMGDLVGEKVYDKFGNEFPLLIKFIDSSQWLSIQVHPDDELAKQRHNAYGKTEMWYIFEAEENAEILSGFNIDVNKEIFLQHLKKKALRDILNIEKANKGDVFYTPAGRIHSLGPGILLAEIQQTSDVTYRVYDWDRVDENGNSRELHLDLALDAIDYSKTTSAKVGYKKTEGLTQIIKTPYFTTNILNIEKNFSRDYSLLDCFVILIETEGISLVQTENDSEELKKGECLLIPACIEKINISPLSKQSELLEVYIE